MKNIKLTLQYDGTRYKGWQKQKEEDNTIQGKLEALLSKMTEEEIQLHGCGRTDAGVHALNYVANFQTSKDLTAEYILDYCYKYLPQDIQIMQVEEVPLKFHARYNAKSKTYVYSIYNYKYRDVFNLKYATHVEEPLDIDKMREATKYLIGTHDFQSFTTLKSKTKSTVRTVHSINFTKDGDYINISYTGDGFLMNMVRIITGTLIEVGLGIIPPEEVEIIRDKKERKYAKAIAEAKGLFLKEVYY